MHETSRTLVEGGQGRDGESVVGWAAVFCGCLLGGGLFVAFEFLSKLLTN